MAEMKRVGLRLSLELHSYYKEKSARMGVPASMLMLMDLEKVAEQRKVQDQLEMFEKIMKQVTQEEKETKDAR